MSTYPQPGQQPTGYPLQSAAGVASSASGPAHGGYPGGHAPPRRSSGGWFMLMAILGLFCCVIGLPLLVITGMIGSLAAPQDNELQEKFHSGERLGQQKVAIIRIENTMLSGEGYPKDQIDRAREDDDVKAVVLRVDSPGGLVWAADYMHHHLLDLRKGKGEKKGKPIVVSMGAIAASGGYYVSMCVGDTPDSIYAEPTTWTGSIGVVIPHYDASGLAEWAKVREDSIKSHPLKQMGSPLKEMTAQEREIFQSLVNESFEDFKAIIRQGRPRFRDNPDELEALATGQVFTAKQALEKGLVDKLGYIEDAIDRAIALGGLVKSEVKVVEYEAPFSLFSGLMAQARNQSASPTSDLQLFLDATRPRAWYILDWSPGDAR